MKLEYHPAVQQDFNDAIGYYETEAGLHVAERFLSDFRTAISAIKAGPTRFPYYQASPVFRRVHLKSFPYVIVYRVLTGRIRVTLLKHDSRHPLHGMQRR